MRYYRNPALMKFDPARLLRNQFRNTDQYINEWCTVFDYFHSAHSIMHLVTDLKILSDHEANDTLMLGTLHLEIPNPKNTTYVMSNQLVEDLLKIPMAQYRFEYFQHHLPQLGHAKIFQYNQPLRFPDLERLKNQLTGVAERQLQDLLENTGKREWFHEIDYLGMMVSRTAKIGLFESLKSLPFNNSTVKEHYKIRDGFDPKLVNQQITALQEWVDKKRGGIEDQYYCITHFIRNNENFGSSQFDCRKYQKMIQEAQATRSSEAMARLLRPPLIYFPPGQIGVISFYITEETWNRALRGEDVGQSGDAEILANVRLAIRLISIFSYSNLVAEEVRPEIEAPKGHSKKEQTQKAREKKEIEAGLHDHYLIKMKVGPRIVRPRPEAAGTHLSPVQHERAAHNKIFTYCAGKVNDEFCETIIPVAERAQLCPNCGSLQRIERLRYCPATWVMGGRAQTVVRDYYLYSSHLRNIPDNEQS